MKETLFVLLFICPFITHAGDGALTILTEPRETDIYINGELKAQTTPAIFKLEEGGYLLEIKKTGYVDSIFNVLISTNTVISKNIVLAPLPPPSEATVFFYNRSSASKDAGIDIEIEIGGKYIGKIGRYECFKTNVVLGIQAVRIRHTSLLSLGLDEQDYSFNVNFNAKVMYIKLKQGYFNSSLIITEKPEFFEVDYKCMP